MDNSFHTLNERIVACELCPRLRAHCQQIASTKRASFREQTYFGKPIPNFGDPKARLLIVGLAPAAHGANRTGRMFTGDRSGDFLYAAMHATGFANQATATHASDGLELKDAVITAAAHCAPPDNKPTPEELANCAPFFDATFNVVQNVKVVLCLGKIGFDAVISYYQRRGWITRKAPYAFAHGATYRFEAPIPSLLCTYHPSQQNTFTGKLTSAMLEDIFKQAHQLLNERPQVDGPPLQAGTPNQRDGA